MMLAATAPLLRRWGGFEWSSSSSPSPGRARNSGTEAFAQSGTALALFTEIPSLFGFGLGGAYECLTL